MKKLKVGMIGGGGAGNFFGQVHRRAISFDATREVVAGALRSSPEAAMEAAEEWGIKGYPDFKTMLEAYQKGTLELDYATIVTPNHQHFAPAKACLEAGLPVLCEKPMTLTVAEAEELVQIQERTGVPLILAHTYTGHPMMMFAKELIASGEIGEIRKIESWYTQGWLAEKLEDAGVQQAGWRTDPRRAGISNCGGDIGTHAMVAATWPSGLEIEHVSARLNTFVQGRQLDDDFNVMAQLNNGATALIWATQIAIGYKNDNGFQIFGSKGSLEWRQERAEKLLLRKGTCDQVYWLGADYDFWPNSIASYLRVPAGHNEDFFEALANLHCSMERQIRSSYGEDKIPPAYPHPDARTGLAGMKFVAAAVESSNHQGAWQKV